MDIERIKCVGFGLQGPHQNFQKIEFTRPAIGDDDMLIEILYAGICHSDLHTVENHWGEANFPLVPGHEIVGKVIRCGKDVKKFKAGDYAGIGCIINSCGECCACDHGREQECKKIVLTYNAKNWNDNDEITQGGYSTCYVVKQDFVIKVDCKEEDLPKIPSLMCAGITTFSPIRQANVEEGSTVFVAGFGGLGHMAAQYLKAINCQVVAFDIEDREELARAVDVKFAKIEEDGEIDESFEKKFDFGIITIPYNYDLKKYMRLLHCGGKLAIVGIPPYDECPDISIKDLIHEFPGVELFGSLIGGISETQLCVDFSIKANIFPIVEEIEPTAEAIDEAYQKMRNREVDGRFVIKMKDFDKPEDKEEITKAILSFADAGADLIICTGGMSVDPDDRTPGGIRDTGAKIVTYGAPVLPGAMLLVAYLERNGRSIPVLGLPGCVMYAKRTVFDLILPRVMADDEIKAEEIAALGEGGLCLNCPVCTFPNCGFGK